MEFKIIVFLVICIGWALWSVLSRPRLACPNCHQALPRFRRPSSARDVLYGGWRCPNCKASISAAGQLRDE